jgi:hypothetical protein
MRCDHRTFQEASKYSHAIDRPTKNSTSVDDGAPRHRGVRGPGGVPPVLRVIDSGSTRRRLGRPGGIVVGAACGAAVRRDAGAVRGGRRRGGGGGRRRGRPAPVHGAAAADEPVRQLRRAEGGPGAMQQARPVVLHQLRVAAEGEPLPPGVLRHHPLPAQHQLIKDPCIHTAANASVYGVSKGMLYT